MRRKLVVGNWKMNGSRTSNAVLLSEIVAGLAAWRRQRRLCACAVSGAVPGAIGRLGPGLGRAGRVAHAGGAYTGEISTAMLQDFGCSYVVIGHSERRAYHGETDAQVAAKTVVALVAGITPIVCIGETLAARSGPDRRRRGAAAGRRAAAIAADDVAKLVLAYEPVWAIGTGKTATPQMAQDVHQVLRSQLAAKNAVAAAGVQILYGGSMKPENAKELMAMPDIDGGLIGGAALKAADFLAIIHAAD
jgi:triosephosphate isomerase